uniref:NADPH oxidase 5 n=1 Tax=Glossina brevipalpis TaxID=37001 RepID=A0A1A9X4W1_9MUSC
MENNLSTIKQYMNANGAHRGSVSSTNSIELPLTPTRSPKKVSFSDELPQYTTPTTAIITTATTTTTTNQMPKETISGVEDSKPPTHNQMKFDNDNSFPVNCIFSQTQQYLDKLHGSIDKFPMNNALNSNKFTSSLSINLAQETTNEKNETSLHDSHENLPQPALPPTKPSSISLNQNNQKSSPSILLSNGLCTTNAYPKQSIDSLLESPTRETCKNTLNPQITTTTQQSNINQIINEEQNQADKYMERYNINLDKSSCSAMELEEFQQKFFHLFDLDNNGYLVQDRWIEHLKGRLTDERQMDYAEQLESVAYVICGENSKITFKNFYDIWNTRGILDKLYRLIDIDGTNLISTNQIMEFISHLTNSRPRTGFDKSSLARLEQLFRNTVGNEKEIRREEFKKIVTSKNPFFTERVFQIFDKDNSGSISLQEFIDAIHQFSGQSADDKIRFLFKVYDIDGDGLIQHKELHDVIRACMEENGMEFSEEQIEDLTTAMFEDADPYNRGEITYEALKNQLHKHGGLLENLSITIDRWLVPMAQDKKSLKNTKSTFWNSIRRPHQLTRAYMKNNHVFVSYLFVYIAINACLFVSRAIQYRASNTFVILARACGQCLNFNCAWILVLMLRHSLTYLRSRGFSTYLPLDNHIYLHKMTGIVISIFSVVHTIMHLFNFSLLVVNDPNLNAANYSIAEWLLTDKPGLFGLVPGCANPTGVALIVILLIMCICSQPFVRRKGSFEIFYWTHLLYVPFWILCLFHGPNFWKWFLVPGIVYVIERILRFVWMRGEHGKTYISSGLLLPSKVIHLVIKRPLNFNFRPGDYVFVNIPTIANYEWHPFTISSAPEQEDYMWLHIRTVGEWTNRLYQYFEKEQQKLHNGQAIPHKQAIPTSSLLRIQDKNSTTPMSSTPQTDFLAKNLNKIQPSPNFDTGTNSKTLQKVQSPSNSTKTIPQNFIPSKLATESISAREASEFSSSSMAGGLPNNDRIRSIKQTLQSTFSRKDSEARNKQHPSGYSNGGYVTDEYDIEGNPEKGKRKKLQRLLLNKPPLEKSLSLPDMAVKTKKRAHLKALHALNRSESERSFDETRMRRARLQSLGLAYLSPQNKSLAQSFRYMRNKPTIIAFKAPKIEQNELELTQTNGNAIRQTYSPALQVKEVNNTEHTMIIGNNGVNANYVVAKPLEHQHYENSQDYNNTSTSIASEASGVTNRFKRPSFLRLLSKSIRNRGSYGSLAGNGRTNFADKVTLDAGVLEIFIDGPYGAPSSHIFMAQHAVLIGTGIGVTPFASILQSIMHRYWKARHTCPRCNFEWASDIPKSVMNLRKVDFFWINRDQRSFEWFVNLLSQLEIEQAELGGAMERFLDMHMYITSALQRTDMKAVGLQLALDLLHEKGKRDLITGLKTRTNAGRPNWDKVFKQLKAQKKGKVTIFYCGPPQLAKTLRYKCDEYGFAFRKECF